MTCCANSGSCSIISSTESTNSPNPSSRMRAFSSSNERSPYRSISFCSINSNMESIYPIVTRQTRKTRWKSTVLFGRKRYPHGIRIFTGFWFRRHVDFRDQEGQGIQAARGRGFLSACGPGRRAGPTQYPHCIDKILSVQEIRAGKPAARSQGVSLFTTSMRSKSRS